MDVYPDEIWHTILCSSKLKVRGILEGVETNRELILTYDLVGYLVSTTNYNDFTKNVG